MSSCVTMSRIFAGPARPRWAIRTEDDTTVKNVNSLIQRVAGTSLGEIENLITRTGEPARPAARRRPARAARDRRLRPPQPRRDEVHAHHCREPRAVEKRGRELPAELSRTHTGSSTDRRARKARRFFVVIPAQSRQRRTRNDSEARNLLKMNRISSLLRRTACELSARGVEGTIAVKTVRPDKEEPIPVRAGSHRMGKIIIRFVVLLAIVAGLDAARVAALERSAS